MDNITTSLIVQIVAGLAVAFILYLVGAFTRPRAPVADAPQETKSTTGGEVLTPAAVSERVDVVPSIGPILFLLVYLAVVFLLWSALNGLDGDHKLITTMLVALSAIYSGVQIWRLSIRTGRLVSVWVFFLFSILATMVLTFATVSGVFYALDTARGPEEPSLPDWAIGATQTFGPLVLLILSIIVSAMLVKKIHS